MFIKMWSPAKIAFAGLVLLQSAVYIVQITTDVEMYQFLQPSSLAELPESGTIHCRVINNECGYGAVDHVYLGARNDILSLMSYWNFVDIFGSPS
jgi:hypothetical protein